MHVLFGSVRLVSPFLPGVLCLSKHTMLDSNKSKWLASYNSGWETVGLKKFGSCCIDK